MLRFSQENRLCAFSSKASMLRIPGEMPLRPIPRQKAEGWRELACMFENLCGGTSATVRAAKYLRDLANGQLQRNVLHPLPFLEEESPVDILVARQEPHPVVAAVLSPSIPLRAVWRRQWVWMVCHYYSLTVTDYSHSLPSLLLSRWIWTSNPMFILRWIQSHQCHSICLCKRAYTCIHQRCSVSANSGQSSCPLKIWYDKAEALKSSISELDGWTWSFTQPFEQLQNIVKHIIKLVARSYNHVPVTITPRLWCHLQVQAAEWRGLPMALILCEIMRSTGRWSLNSSEQSSKRQTHARTIAPTTTLITVSVWDFVVVGGPNNDDLYCIL